MIKNRFLLLIFILLLSIGQAQSQDSTKAKASYKNHFGVVVSPAIIGYIISDNGFTSPFVPIYTTSFFVEYNRVLSKKIWLTAGTGLFVNGFSLDSRNFIYRDNNDPILTRYAYSKSFYYDYNFSIYLKPKLVIVDKKFLFYVGLSTQLNMYMTTYNTTNNYGKNDILVNSDSELKRTPYYDKTPIFYGGIISGVGYKHKRFLFVAEPEFKVNMNVLAESNRIIWLLPYSLGVNSIGYYSF